MVNGLTDGVGRNQSIHTHHRLQLVDHKLLSKFVTRFKLNKNIIWYEDVRPVLYYYVIGPDVGKVRSEPLLM